MLWTAQLDAAAQRQTEKIRQILVPIINSILFLVRYGVALRRHRKGGRLQYVNSCHDVTANEGNLRALLQFKAASEDDILKDVCSRLQKMLLMCRMKVSVT